MTIVDRRFIVVALCGLACAGTVSAASAPAARKKLLAELAWAKREYSELAALRADSLASGFAAWLKVGEEMPVWVIDGERRCERDMLRRLPDAKREEDGLEDPKTRMRLVLRGCRPIESDERGRRRRECSDVTVGHSWWMNDGASVETFLDGSFEETSTWGVGDPVPTYGVLSQITPTAARYRGREMKLDIRCATRCLPCTGGGARMCKSCDALEIYVIERHLSHFVSAGAGHCKGCEPETEPCPPAGSNPDKVRLEKTGQLGLWSVEEDGEPFAGIYRSARECRRDASRFRDLPSSHGEQ